MSRHARIKFYVVALLIGNFFSSVVFSYDNVSSLVSQAPSDLKNVPKDEIKSRLSSAFDSLNAVELDKTPKFDFTSKPSSIEEFAKSIQADVRTSAGKTELTTIATPEAPWVEFDPEASLRQALREGQTPAPPSRVKISGRYRVAAGADSEDFILNDANADLQERNFRYLFGERQNNTYDPAIYSQYLLNVDYKPAEKWQLHSQIVADPWSLVGSTGEYEVANQDGTSVIRPNLKYFGASNSVLNEIYRANTGDAVATPLTKIKNGRTTSFTVPGFTDFGTQYTVPELEVDYEFRPIRKLWVDYSEEGWHARVFALADESQALTSDDPLGLSNHKDYWEQSPWLYQYKPIAYFTDGSFLRGHYSDSLSFLARDSEGNRLVLLRGASVESIVGRTYMAATVAAPYTPWDEEYFSADNIPGAVRIKHRATQKLMIGGTYTFRTGLINNSIADFSQAVGVDSRYQVNDHVKLVGEIAGSHREKEWLADERMKADTEGFAYKGAVQANFDHRMDGHTDFELSYTQMDHGFEPTLSRYTNTRDDHFWGKHLTFNEFSPELEYFRIGDGADLNRYVFRVRWKEKLFKDRFENLFDARNVHRTHDSSYKETVIRDEVTYKLTPKLTSKGLFRWQGLPKTTAGTEPFIANFYLPDFVDPSGVAYQNIDVPADVDPSRFTYAAALQYAIHPKWTLEGFAERSNDIPDFPRGLLNSSFRDANHRVDSFLIDHITNLLYGQRAVGGVPPYDYFTIFRERVLFKPVKQATVTFHAAQNSYKFAGGIDDNINHQGVSVQWDASKKLSVFADFTHSMQIDLPKLIATNYAESDYAGHYNFYASMDYRINSATVFRAEYGVFGFGTATPLVTPYSTSAFALPVIDTEQLFRVSLTGDF